MDWNRIAKGISQAVESAQSIGEKAMDISNKVRNGLDTLKNASEVIKGDSSVINKGAKLAEIAKTAFPQSGETLEAFSESEPIESSYGIEVSNCEQSAVGIPAALMTPTDAISALAIMGTEIAKMGTEIAKAVQICQIEETKRVEIRSRMEVEVTRINAISNLLSDYLNKTFDERAELFDNYFAVLDKAIASGDSELMGATLGSINSLAAQSPFKKLADLSAVQQQLGQDDTLWDI